MKTDNLVPNVPIDKKTIASLDCVKTGRLSMGKHVKAFEEEVAHFLNVEYAVMTNSGSSANLLAASVVKWMYPSVRKVVVPACTWPTSLFPWVQLDFDPMLVDVDEGTLNLDQSNVNLYQKEAVCSTHLMGNPCSVVHDVLIEDACEAFGALCDDGKFAGTRGLMGTFSFFYSHHLITIEGGMVVTNNPGVYHQLLMQRSHGWTRHLPDEPRKRLEERHPDIDPAFLFPSLGYNVRPTEIQAELGRKQLPHAMTWNGERESIGLRCHEARESNDAFVPYLAERGHSWFAYPLLLKEGGVPARKRLAEHLAKHDIPCRPIAAGNLMLQPFARKCRLMAPSLPVATKIMQQGLFVGISPFQTEEFTKRVAGAIGSFDG